MRIPLPSRGLRASVIIAFASVAVLVSLLFAVTTFLAVRHYMVDQREQSALRQTYNDAGRVKSALARHATPQQALDALHLSSSTTVHLRVHGQWHSSGPGSDNSRTISDVIPVVGKGSVAFTWTGATSPPSSVVGISLPAVGAEYYEVVPARRLESTLTTVQGTLVASAAITTLAGTLLGWFASRRLLVPLNEVTDAAARIAAGELEIRLPPTDDPDLRPLVSSFNTMVETVTSRIEHDARSAANVSHELRTPVATLTTSLGVLQHDPDLSDRSRLAVGLMATELARFRQVLEDLIALEHLSTARADSELEVVPVADVIAHVARENHVGSDLIELAQGAAGLEVEINQLQIRHALSNLVRNANTHGGGVSAIRLLHRGGFAEIHVKDQGPGVPSEDRVRIFERFTRLGARRSGSGSGLGLNIVERTAIVHGGTVDCRANSPRGADFVFCLPLAGETA